MQRLLFITERFPPDIGGLARSADRITATLNQLGWAIDVLTWSRYLQPGELNTVPVEAARRSSENPLTVYRLGLYRQWDMTFPYTLNVMDWLHQTHPYTAVWGHYLFPAGFLAVWFAQLNRLPSLVSARGNDIDLTLFPPGDFARLQWTLSHATLVTAVSKDMARKITTLSPQTSVTVLPNAVDTQLFSPDITPVDRASLGILPDELVLVFSGELREKKGQQFLLQALHQVRSHRPACLLILGEVRPSSQVVLQNFAAAYPESAQRIIVTGHLDNPAQVAQHLQLGDLYLQPSLWEGMPNALLEAMACGCCCIASDAGGIPEVIEHGKTGFLLPRAQLHHLGDAILECLTLSDETRQAIGKAAREKIQLAHALDQEKQQLGKILHPCNSLT